MRKNSLLAFVVLMIIWIILMGNFSAFSIISGIIASLAAIICSSMLISLPPVDDVKFFKLFTHILFLIKEIYVQGFYVIKLIFIGAKPDVAVVKTDLNSSFLKAVLINSITLSPGSIPLSLDGDELTVLNLGNPHDLRSFEEVNDLRIRIERNLKKAEKSRFEK
jgi:multicomponent Na+:H+ antiporter subunit E